MKVGDTLYRCDMYEVGFWDDCGHVVSPQMRMQIDRWRVERISDSGLTAYLCGPGHMWKLKRIRVNARVKFAWPTEDEAIDSMQRRALRYLAICEQRLARARARLARAQEEARRSDLPVLERTECWDEVPS